MTQSKPTPFKRDVAPGMQWGDGLIVAASPLPGRRGPSWVLLLLSQGDPPYTVEVANPIISGARANPDFYVTGYRFRCADIGEAVEHYEGAVVS